MILCEILLDLMKYIMKSIMKSDGFHMNLCWIKENLWNPLGFNEILWNSADFSEILITFMKSI